MGDIITWMLDNLNYGTIFLAMLLESTVVPVPSELVVAPAAFKAAGGDLNIALVLLAATVGAMVGASINYVAALYLGRPVIYKFANSKLGHLCLLNQEKVEKSEQYFDKHGTVATLRGRLIPGIRHLISLPAGLARMNYWRFLLYTAIGAGVWHCILAALGWYLHSTIPEGTTKEEQDRIIQENSHYIVLVIVGLVALAIIYYVVKKMLKNRKKTHEKTDDSLNPDVDE